jgi:hypothetical protein
MVSDLVRTTDRATRILDDLLDLARSSVGSDIPIEKSQTDMPRHVTQSPTNCEASTKSKLSQSFRKVIRTAFGTRQEWARSSPI